MVRLWVPPQKLHVIGPSLCCSGSRHRKPFQDPTREWFKFLQKWISQETCLVAVFQVSLVPRLLRIHYITVPCATLRYLILHHVASHKIVYIYIPWHLINSPHIALHLIRLDHMMSLHYVSWHDIALAHTHTNTGTNTRISILTHTSWLDQCLWSWESACQILRSS